MVIKDALAEPTEVLRTEISRLQKDLDDFISELTTSEAGKVGVEAEAVRFKNEVDMTAKLEVLEGALENAHNETSESRKEADVRQDLVKLKIRKEDWQVAKAEMAEAREKAARLEGRLKEIKKNLPGFLKTATRAPYSKNTGTKNRYYSKEKSEMKSKLTEDHRMI